MFRDRLEFTQGDLAEAKNRVMELEGLLARNGEALQSSSQQLVDTGIFLHSNERYNYF